MEYIIDTKYLLELLGSLLANYRDGQGGAALLDNIGTVSREYDRLGLPCSISHPTDGPRNRTADWLKRDPDRYKI
jgi:hypothetical protein